MPSKETREINFVGVCIRKLLGKDGELSCKLPFKYRGQRTRVCFIVHFKDIVLNYIFFKAMVLHDISPITILPAQNSTISMECFHEKENWYLG